MAVKQISRLVIFFSYIVFITKYLITEKPECSSFDLCLSIFVVHNCKFQYLFGFPPVIWLCTLVITTIVY